MRPQYSSSRSDRERGQTTIALVGVMVVGCLVAVAISIIGQAMVHRARARNAADAVALAAAVDPGAADALNGWYSDQGIAVEQDGERTIAVSGPSQAASWASLGRSSRQPAPALVAIIARAEQLQETSLDPLAWNGTKVSLSLRDAALFREVAVELGMCETAGDEAVAIFELC